MPNLSVRKLDQDVYDRLRVRAARHGTSMEEEVRRIITLAVSAPERLGALFSSAFGPDNGGILEPHQRQPHEPLDLGW